MASPMPPPTNKFALQLQEEVIIGFNKIIEEKPQKAHRLKFLHLQNKISAGLRHINSVPEYEMSPTMRNCCQDLKITQNRVNQILNLTTPKRCEKGTQTQIRWGPRDPNPVNRYNTI